MKFGRTIRKLQWLLLAVMFTFAVPQHVMAHGELLIRIADVTRQIEATTNNAQLYLQRGELYREDKNWDAAKADYDHAAELAANLAVVDFCRAKMLDDSGQLEAARLMFDKVLARCPTDGEAFVGRARVLAKQGQRGSAVADYRHGLDLIPEPQPEYFLELAKTLAAENKPDDALHNLDKGIKKFGPIVWLQEYALELELARKDSDAAITRIDTIIERAPRTESWLAQRGEILLAAGRSTEAQKSFEAALVAINTLPLRLQQGPPMQKLQSRVHTKLLEINVK